MHDPSMWALVIGVIGVLVASAGPIVWIDRRRARLAKEHLFEQQLRGVPADPANGIVGVPGVLEQLTEIRTLVAQLRPNGGISLADRMVRIEAKLDRHIADHGDLIGPRRARW